MKKLMGIVLVFAMLFSLTACGDSPKSSSTAEPGTEPAKTEVPQVTWDAKNVQFYVAAKAGGGTDVCARLFAEGIHRDTGKNVVVVNQTEGGGAVCFNTVTTAKATGETIGFLIPTFMTTYISGTHDTNPTKDLQCAAYFTYGGNQIITVSGNSQFKTYAELVEYAKANPGKLKFGIQLGSKTHYTVAEWAMNEGLEFEYVESGSDSDKVVGLMGNLYDVSSINANQVNQYQEAGDLLALASFEKYNASELAALKDLPTVEDFGCKKLNTVQGIFLCVPNGTPESIMEDINAAAKAAYAHSDIAEKCLNAGFEFEILGLKESQEYYELVYKTYYDVAEKLGVNAEGR